MLTDKDIEKLNEALAPKFEAIDSKFGSIEESITNLAIMTKKGFDKVNTDTKETNEKLDDYIKKTDSTLFNLDSTLNSVDTRLKKVEIMLEPLYTGYTIMQNHLRDLDIRITRVEEKTGIKM
jgi:hypothetical protein